jgi:hypothetical protein
MSNKLLKSLVETKKNRSAQEQHKVPVFLKLAPQVIAYFKSQGRGYQTRINEVLTEYVELAKAAGVGYVADLSPSAPRPGSNERVRHGQRLFRKFHAQCFWHLRPDLEVTEALIPLVAEGLRRHGGRQGFLEAKQLLCP